MCKYENCDRRSMYNFEGQKAKFCSLHREEGMINLNKFKPCSFENCKVRPNYNFIGEKIPLFCASHKNENMVNVRRSCAFENCFTQPNYNFIGEKIALYCASHKSENMVNVCSRTCSFEACLRKPSYNFEGQKAMFCASHKSENMVNVSRKICLFENCKVTPNYNFIGEKTALFCNVHKSENMHNINKKLCLFEDCRTKPNYNFVGQKKGLFCVIHKSDGMIDIVTRTCISENCMTHPNYNFAGEKSALYCAVHKSVGMINVKSRCLFEGCIKVPSYNLVGEKKGLFCAEHKGKNMHDVKHKTCKTHLCPTIPANNKYEGYCFYCFVNLFPDRPVARNYKNKEQSVLDHMKTNFPDLSLISDKRIQEGCSRRRPDIYIDLGYQVIIVEIDENQHIDYDCSCENKRLMEISQDVNFRPLIFIRFNPDGYIQNGEKITSCWGSNKNGLCVVKKNKRTEWEDRLLVLENQVRYWLEPKNRTEKTVEVVQLFYDN